jgi:hypothetical protein
LVIVSSQLSRSGRCWLDPDPRRPLRSNSIISFLLSFFFFFLIFVDGMGEGEMMVSSMFSSFLLTGNQQVEWIQGAALASCSKSAGTNQATTKINKPLLYYAMALVDQEHSTLLSFFFSKIIFMCGCSKI